MNNSQFPIARSTGLVVQEMPDEVLVYDLEANKAHCLNQTAATVWRACDGKTSISEISRICGDSGNEDLVWLAIDQLNESNLLEQELKADFRGQSRREVIKKIGLAAVVALPIVASLANPQSGFGNIVSCTGCTSNTDCTNAPGCLPFCNASNVCVASGPIANPGSTTLRSKPLAH